MSLEYTFLLFFYVDFKVSCLLFLSKIFLNSVAAFNFILREIILLHEKVRLILIIIR